MATDFLGEQLTRMAVNWRLNLSREDKAIQRKDFGEILDRVGEQRFQAGVDRAIRQHVTGFFPSVGEFMVYVPDRMSSTIPVCHLCEKWGGYVIETVQDPNFPERMIEKAFRCKHPGL